MTHAHLDPATTIPDLQQIIEDAILGDERSLQTALGPSEIGCACDRCLIDMLAASLAGRATEEPYAAWMPTIGRAVHEWLEYVVMKHLATTGTDRYITEGRVTVGQVGGIDITGSSDLFDVHTGTVVDFKVTGTTTLKKVTGGRRTNPGGVENGPSLTYRRQAHLYGRGWRAAGYDVRSVAIWYLPRNGFTIGAGYLWQQPYDEQIALDALARADMFADAISTFGADAVLASAGAHTGDEFSCPDPKAGDKTARQLDGLIPPSSASTTPQTPDAVSVGSAA